ncbi:hypothetical protein LUZ60_009844 [Juncus effusus]|nr:hypothetical protein LUZ60_009844 [Juncus effusus]
MRVGEKGKLVRNVRYESQRFRVILIVIGCFLISLTFILSSKPDEDSVGHPSLDLSINEAPSTPRISSKRPRKFQDNGVDSDPHVMPKSREDFPSENNNEQLKQATNFGEVGVDLESDMTHRREDLQSKESNTETKPPKETSNLHEKDTDALNLRDVGENNDFAESNEQDPNQKIKVKSHQLDNDENEDKSEEDEELKEEEPKQEKVPTLLDQFNDKTVFNVRPNEDRNDKDDEPKQEEPKEAKIPTLLDQFNENTVFNVRPKDSDQSVSEEETTTSNQLDVIVREIPNANINCDYSDFRSDTCKLNGDIRIHANSSTIYFGEPTGFMNESYKLRPYPRKGDEMAFERVVQFNVITKKEVPKCTKNYDVPAVVFSIGGYTGNIFHDFSDVIMPLFTLVRPLNGEVQFVMTNTQDWWLIKYDKIIKSLSNYTPLRLDNDNEVHCFKSVTVGLVAHRELIIEPSRNPNHYSTKDFTRFIREIFPLERDSPIHLGEKANKKPRMLIISRARSRMVTNLKKVVNLGKELGFEVLVQETDVGNDMIKFAQLINSCDVMLGVHGAGLTNEMFLPPNATLIQIIPWGGLEWIGQMDYGDPAIEMGLNYMQYSIKVEESSFIEKYPKDHDLIKNPIELHKKGFVFIHEVLMNGQNITLDLKRFRNVLVVALDKLTY